MDDKTTAPFVTTLSHAAADPFRLLVEAVTDYGIFMLDPAGCVSSWNPGAEASKGYKAEEIIGKHFSCFYTAKDRAEGKPERGLRIALEKGRFEEEGLRLRKGEVPFWAIATISEIHDAAGKHLGFANVTRDITESRRLASERDALLARLQLHIQRLPLAYVLFDADLRITDWNASAERIFGYTREEVLGAEPPYRQLVPSSFWEEGRELLSRVRAGDMEAHSTNENLTKDGRTISCQWFNTPLTDENEQFIGMLSLARDVTEQKSLQAKFIEAQKMEVIGQLAGGVAHDFNNILAVIIGYSDLMACDPGLSAPMKKYAEEIRQASERAEGLTRQLLIFSRKQTVQPVILDMNDTVKDLEEMLRRIVGEHIEMTIIPGKSAGNIKADSGYVGQVLMNLAVNARDAMPGGGKLVIETGAVTLDESRAAAHAGAAAGNYVTLEVSDTGIGMSDEVKAHLFEAFFTTKPIGKGTGLGMATCQTIVQQCGGFIDVASEVGKGSTIGIYFPRVEGGVVSTAKAVQTGPLPRGAECLLVVEDEPSVRHLSCSVLAAQGYEVLAASNGQDALRVAREHKGAPIRLVITDVIMPVMGGKVMAEWLSTTYPDLKVLFTSGYTDDAITHHGVFEEEVELLLKPYGPATLARRVREVLDK